MSHTDSLVVDMSLRISQWIHEAALNCYTKCPDAPRFGNTVEESAGIDATPEIIVDDAVTWYFHAFAEGSEWNYIRCVLVHGGGYELKKFYSGGGYSGVILSTDRETFFEVLERLLRD